MKLQTARRITALLVCLSAACGDPTVPSTSSSSHWINCASDSDCSNLPVSATCSAEGYCVDGSRQVEQELSYDADFSQGTLDPDALGFETGFQLRNGDDEYYTSRPENVSLQDGELVLTARAEQYEGAEYTSGSVETRGLQEWTFGRIEATLVAPTGRGVGPAFWMLPADPGAAEQVCVSADSCLDSTWPAWGDITIMSVRSESPDTVLMGINYATPDGAGGLSHRDDFGTALVTPTVGDGYHTYAIEWGPERIDWFVDAALVRSVALTSSDIYHPADQNPFQRAFYLKLDVAVGGLSEAPVAEDYPQEMRVRSLRVWQYR